MNLRTNLRRSSAAPRRARRAFTLMEIAVALGVFLLLASVISLAIAQAVGGQTNLRTQRAVSNALQANLEDLSRVPYDQLLGNSFTPPDLCEGEEQSAGDSTRSCMRLGNQQYRVSYTVTPADDALDLNALVELANGTTIEQARRVAAPSAGYAPGTGVLRMTLTGEQDKLTGPVYLLRSDGGTAATGKVTGGGVVLLKAPASACTTERPCYTALAPNGGSAPDNLGLTTSDATGGGYVLPSGGLVEATGRVFEIGTASIELLAQSDTPGLSGKPTEPGSVCIWGRFLDGAKEQLVPLCNTEDGGSIQVSQYAPDPENPEVRRPIPTDVPITLSVDRPDSTCPYVPGMVGSTADGWVEAAVCTSWTWGMPKSFGPTGGTLAAFDSPTITLTGGEEGSYRLVWAGDRARPAAGYGEEPVWAKPRQAAGCAFDGTCVSFAGEAPETTECPGKHCLSAANILPELTEPVRGSEKATTVTVTGAETTFELSGIDRDGDQMRIVLAEAPGEGTLHFPASGGDLAAGTTLVSGSGEATTTLVYEKGEGTARTSFVVELLDERGSRRVTIGLHSGNETWKIAPTAASITQNGTTSLKARTVGVDGEPRPGVSVEFDAPNGITLSAQSAVTDADGYATVQASAGALPAKRYDVAVRAADSGATATLPLTVNPAPGTLDVQAIGAAQGERGYAVIRTTDAAGAALNGVTVTLGVLENGAPSELVYPEYTGCVTKGDGECQVVLVVEPDAPRGTYQVIGRSGDFSDTAAVTVTPTVATIDAESISVVQGQETSLTVTLVDGAGEVAADAPVAFRSSTSGISISPESIRSSDTGKATVQVRAAADATVGSGEVVATASGRNTRIPVQVTARVGELQAGPAASLPQDGETSVWVTVLDGRGAPMAGVPVSFTAPSGTGLTFASKATSGSDGRATIGVSAAPGRAGTHLLTARAGGAETTASVTVEAVLGSVSTQGEGRKDATRDVTFVLFDRNGDPLKNATATIESSDPDITVTPTGPSDTTGALVARVRAAEDAEGWYMLTITVDGSSVTALLRVS